MSDEFSGTLQSDPPPIDGQSLSPDAFSSFPANTSQFLTPEIVSILLRMQAVPRSHDGTPLAARGTWSAQEDELLGSAVKQLGTRKWCDVAKFVPTRTSKQCRERWFHRLSPEIRHEPFEPWEDQIIVDSQRELGNRWALIAQRIAGRSPCSIKNRWYSGLKNQHPIQAQLHLGTIGLMDDRGPTHLGDDANSPDL
jgi:hypothetical protein